MNTKRFNQITASFDGLGTTADTLYTNQEKIDRLKALQAAMMRGVYEKTHAENLRDRDIMGMKITGSRMKSMLIPGRSMTRICPIGLSGILTDAQYQETKNRPRG